MAAKKKSAAKKAPAKKEPKFGDQVVDPVEAQKTGYLGIKADPIPNEEYALTTGPNSPTTLEQEEAKAKAKG